MSKRLVYEEDAIDALKKAYWDRNIQSAKDDPCIVDAMTDWAIRQIKELPSAQPQRKLGKTLAEEVERIKRELTGIFTEQMSAQPQRMKGKWVRISPAGIYECSICGKNVMTSDIDAYDYCHGCGADMRGEEDETD